MSEPEPLRRGKRFHRLVQSDWKRTAEGDVRPEHTIKLLCPPGAKRVRSGRMDLFVAEANGMVVVVEIKATDWDRVRHTKKALGAHRRQVGKYVEKYLDGERLEVCAGVIYPEAPRTPGLKERIEEYLHDHGLQVVWYHDD